jgi:hypothetical protein
MKWLTFYILRSPGSAPGRVTRMRYVSPGTAFGLTRATCHDLARRPNNSGCGAQGYLRVAGGADPGSDSDYFLLPDMALESFAIIR